MKTKEQDTSAPVDETLVNLIAGADKLDLDPDTLVVEEANNVGRSLIGRYKDAKFQELKASIRAIGITQPIIGTIDDNSRVVVRVGFRRLEADKQLRAEFPDDARYATVPVIIVDNATAISLLRAATSENSTGKTLSWLDHAEAVERYAALGMKAKDIAKELGFKSAGTITKLKALRTLPEALQLAAHEGRLDLEVAYELSKKAAEVQNAYLDQGGGVVEVEATPESGDAGAEVAQPASTGTAKKKGKAKAKLTRASVKSAKVTKAGKVSTGPQPRSRDDIHEFFSAMARDKDARGNVKALGKIVVAFMDSDKGKIETVRGKVEELVKRESKPAS